jgi:hypothetical protein
VTVILLWARHGISQMRWPAGFGSEIGFVYRADKPVDLFQPTLQIGEPIAIRQKTQNLALAPSGASLQRPNLRDELLPQGSSPGHVISIFQHATLRRVPDVSVT